MVVSAQFDLCGLALQQFNSKSMENMKYDIGFYTSSCWTISAWGCHVTVVICSFSMGYVMSCNDKNCCCSIMISGVQKLHLHKWHKLVFSHSFLLYLCVVYLCVFLRCSVLKKETLQLSPVMTYDVWTPLNSRSGPTCLDICLIFSIT